MAKWDRIKRAWAWYSHIDTAASLPERIGRHVLRIVPGVGPAVIAWIWENWWVALLILLAAWAVVEWVLTQRASRSGRAQDGRPARRSTRERAERTRDDEHGRVTEWEETARGVDTTVTPKPIRTRANVPKPKPKPKAKPSGDDLRAALEEELRQGQMLMDGLPSPFGVDAIHTALGRPTTTEADVDWWEDGVASLLESEPRKRAGFFTDVPEPNPLFEPLGLRTQLQRRLEHRLTRLETIIKRLPKG